ncbi:MAG: hypothetical protein HYX90_01870 [Chloroflexi bacterium]|nr:hypothetical protein [Chloroflexota bacterium]
MKNNVLGLTGLLLTVWLLMLACSSGPSSGPSAKPSPVATSTPASQPSAATSSAAKPVSTPTPTTKAASTASSGLSLAGKTVTLIVPSAPGGSQDLMTRLMARHLPRFLPGTPSVIVRNMPGGEMIIAANYAYASKPDGLTVLARAASVDLGQLLGKPAVRYDTTKMSMLIAAGAANWWYINSNIISKPEDILKAKGIVYGGSSGSSGLLFAIAKELMSIPTDKVVLSYGGTGDARRAYFAGENNMGGASPDDYFGSYATYIQKREMIPLWQSGLLDDKGDLGRDPTMPDIMTVAELYEKLNNKPPSGIAWDTYKSMAGALRSYDNSFLLPPGTPADIVRVHWDAFGKMVKDVEFHKEVDPLVGKNAPWKTGESLDKGYKLQFGKIDQRIMGWLKETMSTKYGVVLG